MPDTIVLAHGVLGFGALKGLAVFVNYFNGVAAHLRRNGHTVIQPHVNPIGPVSQRGHELGSKILANTSPGERVHIIAHSMGGLDARHAIAHVPGVAERVKTLVTIGTPHNGSPVADAISSRTGPLFDQIPRLLLDPLERNAGALHDLTTAGAAAFNATTPNDVRIRHIAIAGDASKGGHELFLFDYAAMFGHITGEVNDGVVTEISALRPGYEPGGIWPVDHAGEIGWAEPPISHEIPIPLVPPPPHFARYDAIVSKL